MVHVFVVSFAFRSMTTVLYFGIFVPSDSKWPLRLGISGETLWRCGMYFRYRVPCHRHPLYYIHHARQKLSTRLKCDTTSTSAVTSLDSCHALFRVERTSECINIIVLRKNIG